MSSKHISNKLQRKIDKEGILVKEDAVRYTLTHVNHKGKVLGREWHKGFLAITEKRLLLVSNEVKYLNLKKGDDRFTAAKFIENNVACLEVKFSKDDDSKRSLVFHIYSDKVNKIYKRIKLLQE